MNIETQPSEYYKNYTLKNIYLQCLKSSNKCRIKIETHLGQLGRFVILGYQEYFLVKRNTYHFKLTFDFEQFDHCFQMQDKHQMVNPIALAHCSSARSPLFTTIIWHLSWDAAIWLLCQMHVTLSILKFFIH